MRQVVQLVPVEGSTAVKAVGFDSGIIRILWRSGSFNDYEGRSQSDFDDLLASPSKGRFVRERLAGGGPAIAGTPVLTPLDTWDHDDCCSKPLRKAIGTGSLAGATSWVCPKCDVEWTPELAPGLGRHWRPQTWLAVFR
jgi:hypothetical protein